MDYEKKYKESLERANELYDFYKDNPAQAQKFVDIFPELAESEDEKIRKGLIALIKECLIPPTLFRFGLNKEDTVAWLEAQGEQPKKHDVCDNCDQQGGCVSPCPMKLVEKHGEQKPAWSEEANHSSYCQSALCPLLLSGHNQCLRDIPLQIEGTQYTSLYGYYARLLELICSSLSSLPDSEVLPALRNIQKSYQEKEEHLRLREKK